MIIRDGTPKLNPKPNQSLRYESARSLRKTLTTDTNVLSRLPDMTASQVPDLLPWNWKSSDIRQAA